MTCSTTETRILNRPGHKNECQAAAALFTATAIEFEKSESQQCGDRTESDANNPNQQLLAIEAAATSTSPTKKAVVCGFCGEAKEKLLLCGKCKAVRYCHADHQRQHWFCSRICCFIFYDYKSFDLAEY